MKQYKAIFFDWDGTAVLSRKASAEAVAAAMKELLKKGIKLIIVSGTTYENIAGGKLHEYFTPSELQSLFLGLGRGAYNYNFDSDGNQITIEDRIPAAFELLKIHKAAFDIHQHLLEHYHFPTDIVFSRPNYCKIDLMVENNRGENLFFQESELDILKKNLSDHGFEGSLKDLLELSEQIAQENGMTLSATTDAKYLEIGLTSKSDNVNIILSHLKKEFQINPEDCSYWGDEYVGLDADLFGSDSYMMTPLTAGGDFFDVSDVTGIRPEGVKCLRGGVSTFLDFLKEQA